MGFEVFEWGLALTLAVCLPPMCLNVLKSDHFLQRVG